MTVCSVEPRSLNEKIARGESPVIVDVRTPREFEGVHIDGALNYPVESMDPRRVLADLGDRAAGPVYLMCKAGTRARAAHQKLVEAGCANVLLVDGSMDQWLAEGLPVVRGRAGMSVDCQVRIAIGSMVLGGLVLGWAVHPAFVAITAFAGCGLIMAGIRDSCPLAMVVARMPWNRGCSSGSCCSAR